MATQEIKCYNSETDFSQHVKTERSPAILRQFKIGQCQTLWQNPDYLKAKLAEKVCKIHIVDKSQVDKMDFKSKNFKYGSIKMNELIEKVFEQKTDSKMEENSADQSYYLRWVGDDPRGQSRANFAQDFPNLSQDFEVFITFPCQISSVKRLQKINEKAFKLFFKKVYLTSEFF